MREIGAGLVVGRWAKAGRVDVRGTASARRSFAVSEGSHNAAGSVMQFEHADVSLAGDLFDWHGGFNGSLASVSLPALDDPGLACDTSGARATS